MTVDFCNALEPARRPASNELTSPAAEGEAVVSLLAEYRGLKELGRHWVRGASGVPVLVIVAEQREPEDAEKEAARDEAELRRAYRLTRRQAQVARCLARRYTNEEIAHELVISAHTARHHTERVLEKLRLRRRHDVAARLRDAKAGSTRAAS
jgi:DNA-binding CsgD family transcriptional regulator